MSKQWRRRAEAKRKRDSESKKMIHRSWEITRKICRERERTKENKTSEHEKK